MRRIALIAMLLVAAAVAGIVAVASASGGPGGGSYQVRAIFDDASFAVAGEQVRIAGAPVGSIASLGVTAGKKAAVTLEIDDARFTPFHTNGTCAIRPQSLIGEMYVDCEPGTAAAPALRRIAAGPGKGSYYLPVTRTSSPVDFDIVQDIYQQPIAQRLAIILDELGTGLAARGLRLERGHPPGQPGAGQHRPGPEDPGRPEPGAGQAGHRLGRRARTAGPATQGARGLRRPGEHHVGGERAARQGHRRARSSCCPASCASCAR